LKPEVKIKVEDRSAIARLRDTMKLSGKFIEKINFNKELLTCP
jgi:hypothetical protein